MIWTRCHHGHTESDLDDVAGHSVYSDDDLATEALEFSNKKHAATFRRPRRNRATAAPAAESMATPSVEEPPKKKQKKPLAPATFSWLVKSTGTDGKTYAHCIICVANRAAALAGSSNGKCLFATPMGANYRKRTADKHNKSQDLLRTCTCIRPVRLIVVLCA